MLNTLLSNINLLSKTPLNCTKINTPQNIYFDGELSVEANAIWAQYKTCKYTCEYNYKIFILLNSLKYHTIYYDRWNCWRLLPKVK